MESRTWLDRRSLSAFTLGAVGALLTGSGVAIAGNTSLVEIVNAVLAVQVVNATPIAVDVGGPLDVQGSLDVSGSAVDVSGSAVEVSGLIDIGTMPSVTVDNAPPPRLPFQFYGEVKTAGTIIATVPNDRRLVITYINSGHYDEGTELAIFVDHGASVTERYFWDFTDYVNVSTLIYAEPGSTVRVYEGFDLSTQPDLAITGYWEILGQAHRAP